MLAIPVLRSGLGLWEGARPVVPNAAVAHIGFQREATGEPAVCFYDGLPKRIPANAGVLVFDPLVATAGTLLQVLERLEALGVSGVRVRVISALAASPGLKRLGERYGDLTIYTGCIDAELDDQQRILPGLGDAAERLYGQLQPGFVG